MTENNINKITKQELHELQEYFIYRIHNVPSAFKTFYDSRTGKGREQTLCLLGYIMSKKEWVALRDIKKYLVPNKIPHETTLYRLLAALYEVDVLVKEERIESFSKSKPDKRMTNTHYRLSKNAFKEPNYPEDEKRYAIAKRYAELASTKKELVAAKKVLKKYGCLDPEREITQQIKISEKEEISEEISEEMEKIILEKNKDF